ncbi:hypothetical protein BJI60_20185 [Acinetobacter baumannii]|nr:hypothetical protein BJI60_20185 [Acinetobacter baumannii]
MQNQPYPTLLQEKKAPEQIPLGDAAKMSAQLNMRIEPFTWVKEILAERHELVLEKDGVISQNLFTIFSATKR